MCTQVKGLLVSVHLETVFTDCKSRESNKASLGGLDWFGIKVAFSIHRGFLLRVRGVAGIDVVRRDGSCDRTQTGHGDLEELCIKFLRLRRHEGTQVDEDTQVRGREQ